ncbi:hypothetical protein DFJ64_0580 [Thermasporomyces composti]|jgi:hypothetical protein|uniref:Uncharacterized protein n=1 Tax=Thermasporomyces composti TaxID=696763 RepID=A0A3D9V0C3_THECX|nr:hypothetical protein DFJ64_0580 [Thermasporomyces composti]
MVGGHPDVAHSGWRLSGDLTAFGQLEGFLSK